MTGAPPSNENDGTRIIRVLALHGKEGTAEEFPVRLQALQKYVADSDDSVRLEITPVQGPVEIGKGYAWWTMPPGVRSYTATEYGRFEESAARVLDAMNSSRGSPYDIVLGHSQGGILVAALVALDRMPYHPSLGYVLNGVAFPNPYKQQLADLRLKSVEIPPRVLFLLGEKDKMTPNSAGEVLREGLQEAGFHTAAIKHPAGHGFPNSDHRTMQDIVEWIVAGL